MERTDEKSSVRFLSFSNDKEDAEKEAKLKEAAARIEQAIAREKSLNELVDFKPPSPGAEITDLANDTRPLYERLLEQKNKKNELLEESHKLSNLVATLDEEDVSYLNEVAKQKQEEELKKRLEIYDALEEKKRLKEKRVEEEERRMKETLLGSKLGNRPNSSQKLRLSSRLFKLKPKIKNYSDCPSSFSSLVENKGAIVMEKDNQSESFKTSKISQKETKELSEREFNKRHKGNDNDEMVQKSGLGSSAEITDSNCTCSSKDTMKCIGILPSLPIVEKFHDSSESDGSDDGLDRRLVPDLSHKTKHR